MHRSFNTSWRNVVQMEWQSQEDAQERSINPAHPMLSTFEQKLALSITRLKENMPGYDTQEGRGLEQQQGTHLSFRP
jgi:hypothetical protein